MRERDKIARSGAIYIYWAVHCKDSKAEHSKKISTDER